MSAATRPVVVLGSTDFAAGVPLGDWQLARAFARLGHPVLYVDPPRSLLRTRPTPAERQAPVAYPRLAVFRPAGLTGSRRWILGGTQDAAYEHQVLRRLRAFPVPPVVVVATPSHGALSLLRDRYTVVYWQKDRQWANDSHPRPEWLWRRHLELLRSAHVVTGVSQEIVDDNAAQGVRASVVPNGVEYEHWTAPAPEPADLRALARPRVLFSGAWGWRVDQDLVLDVARDSPDLTFVVVGRSGSAVAPTPNVCFLGERSYSALPGYLQHCDVGIIPYATSQFNASSHPLKLLEYAAARLPVVGQGVHVPEGVPGMASASGAGAWLEALRRMLAISDGDRQALTELAAQHTWESRVRTLLALVDALPARSVTT